MYIKADPAIIGNHVLVECINKALFVGKAGNMAKAWIKNKYRKMTENAHFSQFYLPQRNAPHYLHDQLQCAQTQ